MSFFPNEDAQKQPLVILAAGAAILICGAIFAVYFFPGPKQNLMKGRYAIAFHQYETLANNNDPVAQNVIGNLYLLGLGVEKDELKAAQWYLKSALQGSAPAQVNLALLYNGSTSIKRDLIKALGWFHIAKQNGSERAERHIRYLVSSNLMLPNIIVRAKSDFRNLEKIRGDVQSVGALNFLTK